MHNIDWKTKLSSRKLWAAVIAVITVLVVAMMKDTLSPELVELIGKGIIALCVYIFGEAGVDIARAVWQAVVLKKAEDVPTEVIKPPDVAAPVEVKAPATDDKVTISAIGFTAE